MSLEMCVHIRSRRYVGWLAISKASIWRLLYLEEVTIHSRRKSEQRLRAVPRTRADHLGPHVRLATIGWPCLTSHVQVLTRATQRLASDAYKDRLSCRRWAEEVQARKVSTQL